MKKLLFALTLLVAAVFTPARAAVILIDYGPTLTTSVQDPVNTWNNYASFTGTSFALVDSGSNATGFTLTGAIVSAPSGGNTVNNGPASGSTPTYPSSVTSDNIYLATNTLGTAMTMTLSGLSAGSYSFTIFANRGTGGTRQTDFSLAGATTSTFSVNSMSSSSLVATTVSGLNPNGSNQIVITFGNLGYAPGGLTSTAYNTGQYLSSIQIDYTPVPEPGTMAMAILGGSLVLGYRRKRRTEA